LSERVKQLEETILEQKKIIESCKKENQMLTSKKHATAIVSNELQKYFSPSQAKSIMTQKRVNWSEEDIVKGLMLRSLSRKSYQFIRKKKLFPVPSISTLRKWVSKFDCSPGILNDVMMMLKKQISIDSNEKLKLGVFCFDEMDFKKKYEYFQKKDCVFGPSKKVQVGMVRGLCGNWKQPVFFDFDCPMTENLLKDLIEAIESTGIEVWAMTCDGGSSNLALLKKLGINTDHTSFPNPADRNRQIFIFYDVPHLLKLIRNHILDEGIFIDGVNTKISRQDFEELLHPNQNCEHKMLYQLKDIHLHCSGPQRQRVRLAAQLLSHKSASAMKFLHPEKKIQSDFVELIDCWFDVMNSRTKFSKKKLNCGFGIHFEEQSNVINKMISTAQEMKCDSKRKILPFQKGIIISSRSLLSLFSELKQTRNIEFILTSHLNQDCLENFFSRVRALGGTYTHPTTVECINRIRSLIIGRSSDLVVETASVKIEEDESHDLTGQSGFLSQKLTESIDGLQEN